MKNITNIEIIQLSFIDGKHTALLSFQDTSVDDLNEGYSTIEVPVNLREIQLSHRGNMLVNQSVRSEPVAVENTNQ